MITLGLDVGGTKVLALELGADGQPSGKTERIETPHGAPALLDALTELVGRFDALDAVGIGLPGLVDRSGRLLVGPNLPGIVDLAVSDELGGRLGLPVTADNDATCATWAEAKLGAARGHDDAVLVTLGTGIGGGIVAGGQLQRGANGFGGEPGHMVVDPNGPRCPCGRRGCWERYASGSGLGRLGREAAEAGRAPGLVDRAGGDAAAVRGEHVTEAAAAGDEGAIAVMREFGWWAALGIANLVALLDPSIVVIGGGLVEAGDVLLAPITEQLPGMILAGDQRAAVPVVPAQLGEHAGAIGAALIARDRGDA